MSSVLKTSGLCTVDCLRERVMEEGILNVQLVNGPPARERQGQNCANGRWLDHKTKSLIEVHTWALSEPAKNPASLVPLQRTISLELVLVDPLAGDQIGARRPRD